MRKQTLAKRFFELLAYQLIASGKTRLVFDDSHVGSAMQGVVRDVYTAIVSARDEKDNDRAYDLLELLEKISPNPTTGAFDGFWMELRELQPALASANNPYYPELELKGDVAYAKLELEKVPEGWKTLLTNSAEQFAVAA